MIARPVSSIAGDGGEIVWFAHVTSDSGRTLEYVRHAMTDQSSASPGLQSWGRARQ